MKITITQAAAYLQSNQVVAIPTETVYGLAAYVGSPAAIETIFQLKGRPRQNPLIVHVKSIEECLSFITEKPPFFDLLTKNFWPGPLTLILPVQQHKLPDAVRSGLPQAAFRMPAHPLARELLQLVSPLVAPSANISGKPSATKAEHVENDFGPSLPVVDGGASTHGLESTIIAYSDGVWKIARVGSITKETLSKLLGYNIEIVSVTNTPICPGQLFRHYAPRATLTLSKDLSSARIIVGYSDRAYNLNSTLFSLGSSKSPEEVSFNLYNTLRHLDIANIAAAHVDIDIPSEGLWSSILERLQKAASS